MPPHLKVVGAVNSIVNAASPIGERADIDISAALLQAVTSYEHSPMFSPLQDRERAGTVRFDALSSDELAQLHRTEDELKDWQENVALFKQLQAGEALSIVAKEGLVYYFQACQKDFSEQGAMHTAFKKALPLVKSVLIVLDAKCQTMATRTSP